MRWLLTGATGFTGRQLRDALRMRGEQVTTVGRSPENDCRCDLADADGLAAVVRRVGPAKVVHLAAVASVLHGSPADFQAVNVRGTENLIRACAALTSPPALTLASSSHVYGAHAGVIGEDAATMPISDYGRSKLAMEAAARRWADKLPILVARPFNYTGPGQPEKYLVAKIAGCFRRRDRVLVLGDTSVIRDFSDVADIVEDYLSLMTRGFGAFEIVNLCSGAGISVATIVQTFAGITGHQPEVLHDEQLLRSQEIPLLIGDPSKLASLSGRVHRRPFAETVAAMLAPASTA